MKPKRFHGLKRPKLRQSWNKYNLYNIARQKSPAIGLDDRQTFFQQKWRAKGMLRAYHGEHISERKWQRMFSRRVLGVAPMDAKEMALTDGSRVASGRGSGREPSRFELLHDLIPQNRTPYMQMTFAPMERRLDIAVFRAMFASSARQARQFCVHGAVKVNGKMMPFPAYRLNPGDMFQVEPEKVLFATGAKKRVADFTRRHPKPSAIDQDTDADVAEESDVEAKTDEDVSAPEQDPETTDASDPVARPDMKPTRQQIIRMTTQIKSILEEEDLRVAQKRKLRKFIKDAKPLLSRIGRPNATPADITKELNSMMSELHLTDSNATRGSTPPQQQQQQQPSPTSSAVPSGVFKKEFADLSPSQFKELEQRMADYIREDEENPIDASKPYATPWRPRNYMSPFACIPAYLEVNQNICSAVYLRHPVARPGQGEVPTPYNERVSQLAYNWYLRRR
ncbi:alpha-L RNA-binding motif-containing protein [Xylariomycetidae sp. FL0641]|nr:alpha-L RNA-binding motif-containing protein [Xylariomycetidae sp. FL0641]